MRHRRSSVFVHLLVAFACLSTWVVVPGTGAAQAVAQPGHGYWLASADGEVFAFGEAGAFGTAKGVSRHPIVDITATPTGQGYWLLATDGGVFAFGDAHFFGSLPGSRLRASLGRGEAPVALAATARGDGYWLVTNRGRVVPFGAATSHGDLTATALNAPIVAAAGTASGNGYWMAGGDGGVFAFGDARFLGSLSGVPLNAPVNAVIPTSGGGGYWLVAGDGGIFSFSAGFFGSLGATRLNRPITGATAYGDGYLLVGADGGVFNFSDAPFHGSLADRRLASDVVGVAPAGRSTVPPVTLAQPTDFVLDVGPLVDPCVNEAGGTSFGEGPCHIITMTWVGQDTEMVLYGITPEPFDSPQTTLPIGPASYPHVGADYTWTFAMRPASSVCVLISAYRPDLSEFTLPTRTCVTTP